MTFLTWRRRALAAAALFLLSGPAWASDEPPAETAALELSANVALASDYRFRGISLSNRNPAIQGGVDLSHESGFFVGTWASSIADTAGAHVEVDLYGGYAGAAGPVQYTATVLYYAYPGGKGVDYWELSGALDADLGPAALGVDIAWVPRQDNFGGDNFYLAGRATVPLGIEGASLFGHLGRENGDVYRGKWDWEAGLAYEFSPPIASAPPLTASVSYVDSNYGGAAEAGRLARAGVVATLSASF